MSLPLQTAIWQLAHTFVRDYRFSVFHIEESERRTPEEQPQTQAIHLIREQNRRALYLRVVPLDNYWAQVVERDVTESKRRFAQLAKRARTKLDAVNVYVMADAPPEDMVSRAQSASVVSPRAPFRLNALFLNLDQKVWEGSFGALERWGLNPRELLTETAEEQRDLQDIQNDVRKIERERERKVLSVFQYGKPFFTYGLIAVNTVIYALALLNGGTDNIDTLLRFGAKSNGLIVDGEWWRLITPLFLHLSHWHFLFNTLALYFLGTAVERIFGNWRFLAVYLLAGVSGSVASFAFTDNLSAGASGAIFGCFGALLVFGQFYPKLFFRTMGRDILFFLGLNLALGFMIPNVDNYGHIGGLVGGYLSALFAGLPLKRSKAVWRLTAGVILTVLLAGLFNYGYTEGKEGASYLSVKGQELLREGRIEDALKTYQTLVEQEPEEPLYHFYLGYVYSQLEVWDQAEAAWKTAIKLNADFMEAHFNLALLYARDGRTEEAIAHLYEAKRLDPKNEDVEILLKELEG